MWKFCYSLQVVFWVGVCVDSLMAIPSPSNPSFSTIEVGTNEEALFLTPYLENGKAKEVRKLSKVRPDIGNEVSYSGYFTVNKECQSNLFFWFFPAKNIWKQAPVMLWLQGGPGSSSLYGLFEEIGPFSFDKSLKHREHSWNVETNLLFIDQPVGTGFSFTGKGCYAKNETQVSEELYSAIVQFFQLFPEIKENKFIVAGESFAGQYIPAIGYKIHNINQYDDFKVNFQGMMIGNGFMDVTYQHDESEYLFQIGLGDYVTKAQPGENQNLLEEDIHQEFEGYDAYNYIKSTSLLNSPYTHFLEFQYVRKSIHVGNNSFKDFNPNVSINLASDDTKIKPLVEELLEYYPIVFYNGQLDTVCPYPPLVKFLRALDWTGAADYKRAPRHKWCEDGVPAGYHKSSRNLHEVMVRSAGHMVPKDQPLWAFRLAHSVISNYPSNPLISLPAC